MSNCTSLIEFPSVCGRSVVADFSGGDLSSDAGVMLLAHADRKIGLTSALAGAIVDRRQRGKVRHDAEDIISARIYAIGCGYEDANDHDDLRNDSAFKVACGHPPVLQGVLASQPTISRLENAVSVKDLVRMAKALALCVIGQLPADETTLYLDVDATDDPCHGQQELELFNAHYGNHCYLPLLLYVTASDGRQWLLGSVLRSGKASYRHGLFSLLRMAVHIIRERFPEVKIVLRADAGFGYWDTLELCERIGIDYLLGLSVNSRLTVLSTSVQMDTCLKYKWVGDGCREYGEFQYKAGKWRHARKVVVKAEITGDKLHARYVVTNLEGTPEKLYALYCERGDRENRIKELKLDLASGRTSCHRFLANQMRLLMHAAAATLMTVVQCAAEGTRLAGAQVGTLRLRILKVAARVMQSCRRILFKLPTSFPDKEAWIAINHRLSQMVT